MPLPKAGTDEWTVLVEFYVSASPEERQAKAQELGMRQANFERQMRARGVHTGARQNTVIIKKEPEVEYIPYPKVNLKPFKKPKARRDQEDIVVVISDSHLAKITENYDIDIAQARFDYLLNSTMTIINLHQPIRKAHLFLLGDIVQGENPYQGSKVGEVKSGAYEQIHEYAIPMFYRFCMSLKQGVSEIDVYGVRGNHGKYAREAPDKTNWDRFFYKALDDAMGKQAKVNIHPPSQFYQLINIRGFRFFLVHGDQVYATAGIPLFAMRRKMQEWYAYVGGFNYGYAGHFHTGAYDQVNSHADYTISPPLVTGDAWALEKIGRASEPKQLCFGVHDKYGRTFEYKLHTDDTFLPQKFDEPEGVIV